jgi:exoribonuclease II
MPDSGNAAQTRVVAEQVAEATITRFVAEHPELRQQHPVVAETPPLIKWVVGAAAALGLAAMIGGGSWLVSSVSQMQVTLARLDERMTTGAVKDARFDDLERRVARNEAKLTELGK